LQIKREDRERGSKQEPQAKRDEEPGRSKNRRQIKKTVGTESGGIKRPIKQGKRG